MKLNKSNGMAEWCMKKKEKKKFGDIEGKGERERE